jgi:beta-glucosidase
MPTLGKDGDLSLYDMFTADYDNDGVPAYKQFNDPAWAKLLEQVTLEELISIGDCFHWRHAVPSVNAPGSRDENGPQGLSVALFGSGLGAKTTAFTSEDVMAATFNLELMNAVGVMIGNDCLDAGVSCLYGPGANTHRTPYGGRNFEYYSEDGFLAGEMGGIEVKGILSKGVDVVMKHFALNDSEQERLGQAAWIGEQAAREIYLKAFQKALEENGGRGGVMTAYTRFGTTWSAANYGLMTGILREEWGNNSMHITDNMITENCNALDGIMAGGITCFDAMMSYATDDIKTAIDDPVFVNAMLEATHHNLYTIINSAAMNGVGADTEVIATTPQVIMTLTYVTIAAAALLVVVLIIKRKLS